MILVHTLAVLLLAQDLSSLGSRVRDVQMSPDVRVRVRRPLVEVYHLIRVGRKDQVVQVRRGSRWVDVYQGDLGSVAFRWGPRVLMVGKLDWMSVSAAGVAKGPACATSSAGISPKRREFACLICSKDGEDGCTENEVIWFGPGLQRRRVWVLPNDVQGRCELDSLGDDLAFDANGNPVVLRECVDRPGCEVVRLTATKIERLETIPDENGCGMVEDFAAIEARHGLRRWPGRKVIW